MTKMRQWSLLTGLSVVVVLVAGWMLLVKPQHTKAAQIDAQTQSVQQQNAMLANKVASLRAESKNIPAEQALLASIATKIPNNPALPGLIRSLTSAASAAGVDLVSIAPATPTAVTGAPATGSTPTASHPAAPSSPLDQIQLSLNVKGTYFTIESFFSNLEGLTRALRVTSFSLSGTSQPSGGATAATPSAGGMTATITADVYMTPGDTGSTSTASATGSK